MPFLTLWVYSVYANAFVPLYKSNPKFSHYLYAFVAFNVESSRLAVFRWLVLNAYVMRYAWFHTIQEWHLDNEDSGGGREGGAYVFAEDRSRFERHLDEKGHA